MSDSETHEEKQMTRKEFLKKAAYATPIIVSLAVKPSYAALPSNIKATTKQAPF